ncbi:MAG: AraC family transcriptional regulator [Firmicutes bacterium]|nr:AraC family transcriptional regulator [Bacillota bacterium]
MTVTELAAKLNLRILTQTGATKKVTGVYSGDLLSWVMSHAKKNDAWVTVHTHVNIVAVAVLAELACIIIPEGIEVEAATLAKAEEEGIALLGADADAAELCWRIYEVLH